MMTNCGTLYLMSAYNIISMWIVLATTTQHHFSGLSSNRTLMIKITPHPTDNGLMYWIQYVFGEVMITTPSYEEVQVVTSTYSVFCSIH